MASDIVNPAAAVPGARTRSVHRNFVTLVRRETVEVAETGEITKTTEPTKTEVVADTKEAETACGSRCVFSISAVTALMLLVLILAVAVFLYRKRQIRQMQEEADRSDWEQRKRQQMASLSVGIGTTAGQRKDGEGLQLPRRPSKAELAQMEVYRKMSVIGIV